MQTHEIEQRSSLPTPPTSDNCLPKTKLVRFSDVIRYSDHRIGYLEHEDDDDICSFASEENGEGQRWGLEAQLPPSPPLRRSWSLTNRRKSSSLDPPSPPLRRRSNPKLETSETTFPPTLPQRRGTLDHHTEAEDESILDSPRLEDSFSPRILGSSVRKSSWFPLMSGDSDDYYPPIMPKRKPSRNGIDKASKDNGGPSNGDCCNARWELEVPPPLPSLLVSE